MNAKAEKVARMMGKTTYKDFRQGFARTMALDADGDMEIKAALGIAQKEAGAIAVKALETHYASTLAHERELRRAWDAYCGVPENPSLYPVRRLGCSLAIIEHAGRQVTQSEVKEYAWMLHTNYQAIIEAIHAAGSWLEDLTGTAERAFKEAIREVA